MVEKEFSERKILYQKIIHKALDIYEKSKSMPKVHKFLDRVKCFCSEVEDPIMQGIQNKHFQGFTVYRFIDECLDMYRNGKSLVSIFHLSRDLMPLTESNYRTWVMTFSEEVEKLPNPPTPEDWEDLEEWILQ